MWRQVVCCRNTFDILRNADLKFLLQHSDPPFEWPRKGRWAAQIAHGVIGIQKKGVMHGDLLCANVVIDKFHTTYLIDIVVYKVWFFPPSN